MASQLSHSFKPQAPENGSVLDNMEFIPTQVSPVQWEEDFSNSPNAQLNFPPNDKGSCAKQELQALWEMFTSWLQPEKHSKEEMISQLVLKEFLLTGQCKDKIAFKEKWEASGRNMGRFMESLTDECLQPPIMVHVSMQGEEALFSEDMSVKEAIKLLKEQQSARTSTQENARTPLPIPQDTLLAPGHEDCEDGQNNPWSTSVVNGGDSSPGNQTDSLIIIQKEQFPEPEDLSVSYRNPQDYRRTSQATSSYQEESQRATTSDEVPMQVQQEIISRPEQTEDCQKHDANSTLEGHQERLHRDPKTYKCEQCPKTFKYPCNLAVHQKVHKKERSFFCTKCHKGFYRHSDLKVHEVIHQENKPPNDNGSCAKKQLQALWEMFTSWLQPEKHSEEEMISQLVWTQFLKTGHCKDKIALKEKWEARGRNMKRFTEGLTDECLKPPVMVHVSMQGQEALFSENMSLKETVMLLKEQQSARTSTQENARTPLPISQDMLLATGHEDCEDGQNNPWSTSVVNGGDSSPGNQTDSLIIIQKEQFPEPEDLSVSYQNAQDYRRTSQVTSRHEEESQRATSSEEVPMEVQPQIISRSEQTEDCQKQDANSTLEGHQERLHRDPKTYKCEQCPKTFKYPCRLLAHQKVHKKERSFFCTKCHKGFYSRSDLKVHEVIHQQNKPFQCSTCGKSFSNKTNLQAHERIHTGEKPYTCSLCNRSFRQSSTYHRHRRKCHKHD